MPFGRFHTSTLVSAALLALCVFVATPFRPSLTNNEECAKALTHNALAVNATGIEEGGNWAIIKARNKLGEVVSEGEEFFGCLQLVAVNEKSVVIQNTRTNERRELFLTGQSSPYRAPVLKPPTTNEDFVQEGMRRHSVVPVSSLVDKIEYPASTNFAHLPKIVYHNRAGSSFYGDYQALGLGERGTNTQESDSSSHISGVRINGPSEDSFLASLGLKDGQKIVAVNGQFVKSPEDVSRLMEARDGGPLSIGYYDPDSQMILATHGIVTSN